jgi:hypothetical protein
VNDDDDEVLVRLDVGDALIAGTILRTLARQGKGDQNSCAVMARVGLSIVVATSRPYPDAGATDPTTRSAP